MDASDVQQRVDELLHRNLAREREQGRHRAWVEVREVLNEEWGKHLTHAEVQALIEAVFLTTLRWYRLAERESARYGIIGYEYTDEEGARRTSEYSGYFD
jgi:hypothetical protein